MDYLCDKARDAVGGGVIDVLCDCLNEQGDEKARQLYSGLLEKVAIPYFRILSLWLFR